MSLLIGNFPANRYELSDLARGRGQLPKGAHKKCRLQPARVGAVRDLGAGDAGSGGRGQIKRQVELRLRGVVG